MTLLQGKVGAEESSGLCVQRGAVSFALLGGRKHLLITTRRGGQGGFFSVANTAARAGCAVTAEWHCHPARTAWESSQCAFCALGIGGEGPKLLWCLRKLQLVAIVPKELRQVVLKCLQLSPSSQQGKNLPNGLLRSLEQSGLAQSVLAHGKGLSLRSF